jgi:hypothetical protein
MTELEYAKIKLEESAFVFRKLILRCMLKPASWS